MTAWTRDGVTRQDHVPDAPLVLWQEVLVAPTTEMHKREMYEWHLASKCACAGKAA